MKSKFIISFALILFSVCSFAQTPVAVINSAVPTIGGEINICVNQSVIFFNNSTQTTVNAQYAWSFGAAANPSTSNASNSVSVAFSQPGTYNVALTVDNNNGAPTSTASMIVQVLPLPAGSLSLVNTGAGFSTVNVQGEIIFKQCSIADSSTFIFNPACTNCTQLLINWGDGTTDLLGASSVDIAHDYPVGQFEITVTALNALGCASIAHYGVFNGSSPVITVSGSGQNTCVPFPYPIDILSNGVPIQYTVSYSDGSDALSFETSNDTTISHSFLTSSCGAEYYIAPSLPPIQNAYSATILAQNICSANGFPTVFTIGPITISEGVDPQISMDPISPICMNEEVTFSNASQSGLNITSQGCDTTYQFFWRMQETVGFTLINGTLGASNGFEGPLFNTSQWTTGSEDITYSFDTPGFYHLWLFTGSPCGMDSVEKVFEIKPLSSVLVNPMGQTICSGNEINPVTFTSVVPEYNIYWEVIESSDVQGIPQNSGMGASPFVLEGWTLSNNSAQVGYVDVSATVGCTSVDPVVHRIWVDPQGNVEVNPSQQLICNGTETNVTISSNLNGVNFIWTVNAPSTASGASGGTGNSIQQVLSTSVATLDTLYYHVTIENNVCPGQEADVQVIVQAPIVINPIGDGIFCPGENIPTIDIQTNFTSANVTWQNDNTDIGLTGNGNGDISSWTAGDNTTNDPIVGTITISAEKNDCPTVEEIFQIQIQPVPNFNYTLSPSSGLGCVDPVTVMGSSNVPNVQVSWNGNGVLSGQNTLTPVMGQAGSYQINLTDPLAGCVATDTVVIQSPTFIQLQNVIEQNISCNGNQNGSIQLETDASGNEVITYNWVPAVSNGNAANNLGPGLYQYEVTNVDGCKDNGQTNLSEPELLQVTLLDSASSQCGESNGFLNIQISGGTTPYQVNWSNSIFSGTELTNVDEGQYSVIVTDDLQCEANFSVELNCVPFPELIPYEFISPNEDGANDQWILLNLVEYEDAEVQVYNRWGTLVYESRPYKNDWSGECNVCAESSKLPSATYFYKVTPHKKSKDIITGFIEVQP